MNTNLFKTKEVKITRKFDVYDGPELPYIDSDSCIIVFEVDKGSSFADCIESIDYDDYKSAVLDSYPITDAINDALENHKDGDKYELECGYDFGDYDNCVVGDFYFENDIMDDYPRTRKIVRFSIVKKDTEEENEEEEN